MLPDELIIAIFAFAHEQDSNIIFTFRRLAKRYYDLFDYLVSTIDHEQRITNENIHCVLRVFKHIKRINYEGTSLGLYAALANFASCESLKFSYIDLARLGATKAPHKNINRIHFVGQSARLVHRNFLESFPNLQHITIEKTHVENTETIKTLQVLHLIDCNNFVIKQAPYYHTLIINNAAIFAEPHFAAPSITTIHVYSIKDLNQLNKIHLSNLKKLYIHADIFWNDDSMIVRWNLDYLYIKTIVWDVIVPIPTLRISAQHIHIKQAKYLQNYFSNLAMLCDSDKRIHIDNLIRMN